MTIGDVLAAVSVLLLLIVSWAALLLTAAYLLPGRVEAARERIERSPARCGVHGAMALLAGFVFIMIVSRGAFGAGRLLPMVLAGAMIVTAAIGSAGLVQLIAWRSVRSAPWSEPGFSAMARAAGIYVLAGLVPVCGWFVVTPIALCVSLGAALPALLPRRASQPAIAKPAAPSTELAASSPTV